MPQLTHGDKKHLRDLNTEIARRLQPLFRDLEQTTREIEAAGAKRDPKAHKLSRVMADGKPANWRYYRAGKDGKGRTIRFCHTSWKNVAGFYLFFREVRTAKQIKRDQWAARKTRKEVAALARRRSQQFKEGTA